MLKRLLSTSQQQITTLYQLPRRGYTKYSEDYFSNNYELTLQMKDVLKKEYTFKTQGKLPYPLFLSPNHSLPFS